MKDSCLPSAVILVYCALFAAHNANAAQESTPLVQTQVQSSLQTQVKPQEPRQAEDKIEVITVVAHRQPRALSEIAGTVTVIDQDELNRYMILDLAGIARYQPGIEVDKAANRFGYGSFRIRGIGGNRSVTVVDNIPVPDSFSVGSYSNAGRGLLELGLVSHIEFLRGPASTLYGSKALGGVAAMQLLDAKDLLTYESTPTRIQMTYNSESDRYVTNLAHAFRSGRFSTLLAGVYQKKQASKVAGLSPDQAIDKQDIDNASWLFRTTYASDYGDVRLTLNALHEKNVSDLQASLGTGRLTTTTLLLGDDKVNQKRAVLDWTVPSFAFVNRGVVRAWFQQSDTQQDTYEERMAAVIPVHIWRDFNYKHQSFGLGADFESQLADGRQRLGYGFEWVNSHIRDMRDGQELNLITQTYSKILLGEQFPLRDFPKTELNELSLYVHNEIELWPQGLVVSPGLRFEHYELQPQPDALFDERFPNAEQTALSTQSWLPKLGLLLPFSQQAEWFAQYAKGHRAPPFSDVNIGLYYPQLQVHAISNPDLKAETGQTFETGIRWRHAATEIEAVVFYNKYKNFIQSRAPIGKDPITGDSLFQSINRDRVTIKGSELRLKHSFAGTFSNTEAFASRLVNNLDVFLNVAWLDSKDHQTGEAMSSVSPANAQLELVYYSPSMAWETRFVGLFAKAQKQLFASNGSALFSTPGYASFDLLSRWYATENLQINLGLYNLTNKAYWQNSSVIDLAPNDPNIPLLAESGRHVAVAFSLRF